MKSFHYEFRVTGDIEVDDIVFESVLNDEWRKTFYPSVRTEADVAGHLAFNIALNGSVLSGLDGFADLPESAVRILNHDTDLEDVEAY